MTSGVYLITNLSNHKKYIGSSKWIESRFNGHKSSLRLNKHGNCYLQSAWNKYGEKSFKFEVLEITNLLLEREQFWLDKLQTYNNSIGYNIAKNARAFRLGIKASEETKKKMSLANKGQIPWCKGLTIDNPIIKKISEKIKGVSKPNSGHKKKYKINFNNQILEIEGVRKFCRDNQISQSKFYKLIVT